MKAAADNAANSAGDRSSGLRIVFQMDPPAELNPQTDSTLFLALRAQERGHRIYYLAPEQLGVRGGCLVAAIRPMTIAPAGHAELGAPVETALDAVDVILIRQDPPFDMDYITTTYLLELPQKVLVLNRPAAVRSFSEKLVILRFPDLIPPTILSRDPEEIADFRLRHRDVVIKPLYGNGGAGVFIFRQGDHNLQTALEILLAGHKQPVMAQAFLPEVTRGDKRIILIGGYPAGAINRRPAEGSLRANLHVGAVAERAGLSPADHRICDALRPFLQAQGLVLVGIDVIGGYLTEVNVTSPTGLQELWRLADIDAATSFWETVEQQIRAGG